MKLKFSIEKQIPLPPDILEEKINNYLKKNFYRITDKGLGYIIFIDDEYSDRKRYRSDFHTRIGEGKFEFHAIDEGTHIKLIYFTQVLYPLFIMMLFGAMGIYVKSIVPILMSFALSLPIIFKVYFIQQNVFNDVLES